jgi:hypothetical protein
MKADLTLYCAEDFLEDDDGQYLDEEDDFMNIAEEGGQEDGAGKKRKGQAKGISSMVLEHIHWSPFIATPSIGKPAKHTVPTHVKISLGCCKCQGRLTLCIVPMGGANNC